MEEENMTKDNQSVSGETGQGNDTVQDLISALNEIKQNTVSKETYDKLREDNRKLMDTIVNGQTSKQPEVEEAVDVDEIRAELFGDKRRDLSNREYVEKMLTLRKELIKKGEPDPFVMRSGKRSSPEKEDFEKAEDVAKVLQSCIDIADGNDDVFNNEFQRRLV